MASIRIDNIGKSQLIIDLKQGCGYDEILETQAILNPEESMSVNSQDGKQVLISSRE